MQLCNDAMMYYTCDEWMELKCTNTRYLQQKKFSLIHKDSESVQHIIICLIKAHNLLILIPSLI